MFGFLDTVMNELSKSKPAAFQRIQLAEGEWACQTYILIRSTFSPIQDKFVDKESFANPCNLIGQHGSYRSIFSRRVFKDIIVSMCCTGHSIPQCSLDALLICLTSCCLLMLTVLPYVMWSLMKMLSSIFLSMRYDWSVRWYNARGFGWSNSGLSKSM